MGKIDLFAELVKDNPKRSLIELQIYADALTIYTEASANVKKHGSIVMHPRTGAPIENPYLKIQTSKGAAIAKMPRVKSNRVVNLLEQTQAAAAAIEVKK